MTIQTLSPASLPPLVTKEQLAERWNVTTQTLWNWRRAGKLRAVKLGASVRFAPAEIERFERESIESAPATAALTA